MRDLFWVAAFIVTVIAISDILKKLQTPVARTLWIVCVLAIPFLGAGFWYYVQYVAPKMKELDR